MTISTKVETIYLNACDINKNARIYIKELTGDGKEKKWLALLPLDYYGEEAFLYKKVRNGYSVTGRAFIVNKNELKQKQNLVRRDYRYAYVQAIYV